MKNTWKKWGLVLFSVFIFGFKGNDSVELGAHFNARKDANFWKNADNIKFVLAPKTRGKILKEEVLKPSGNMGFYIEVLDGPKKGEKVWIYYDMANLKKETPDIRLFKSDDGKAEETKDPKEAKSVQTEKETPGWMPERIKSAITTFKAVTGIGKDEKKETEGKPTAEEAFRKIELANRKMKEPCTDCETKKTYQRPTSQPAVAPAKPVAAAPAPAKKVEPSVRSELASGAAAKSPETKFTANVNQERAALIGGVKPIENRYPVELDWRDGVSESDKSSPGYQVGRRGRGGPIEGFRIVNTGPNKTVSPGAENSFRSWDFYHVGNSRQDLSFYVRDSYGKGESAGRESLMMVFPRNTLPQVRTKGDKVVTTLANGETITFDKKTQQVIGGVFSETGAMAKGTAPRIQYHGKGVLVRADSSSSGDARESKTVTISKQGKPDCKVPTTDLWPRAKEKHFKYFSDTDFESYLRQKCGFGMIDK